MNLRPSILDNMGMLPAIRWLVNKLSEDTGINARLNISGTSRKLNTDTEVIIFRVIQEALNNIRRHSQATELLLDIEFGPEILKVSVRDNGKGFHMPKSISTFIGSSKVGILGMQENINIIGGKLDICSEPGNGTLLKIEVKA